MDTLRPQTPVRFSQALYGFTLIELLVVVAIIAVLLVLLVPAMEQAIYQAELTVCGSQMRGISEATIAYATENKRTYPDRALNSSWDALQIKSSTTFDIPLRLQSYVAAKMFYDPFLRAGKLDVDECMRDPYGVYMPGYMVYTDWGNPNVNVSRMKRLGQKMVFDSFEGDRREFGVILADRDSRRIGYWATSSHPDKEGVQSLWTYQAGGNPWLVQGLGPVVGPATGNVYVAWWQVLSGAIRGKVDNNYALDDGSILRYDNVPVVQNPSDDDPRINFIPDVGDPAEYKDQNRKTQLPAHN